MSKYTEYQKQVEKYKDTPEGVLMQIALDIRYSLNSIDKQLKRVISITFPDKPQEKKKDA